MKVEVPEYEIAERVSVDPETTALLIGDMQNDFVRREGKLCVPTAEETIGPIRKLRDLAREHHMQVVYTQDTHHPGDREFEIWGEHCLIDTEGWEFVDELRPDPRHGDRVYRKRRYDGFYGTSLGHDLHSLGIETLICTGTVANICVMYSASGAALRWIDVILPVDGISALDEFDLQVAIRQVDFPLAGTVTRSDEIVVAGT